MGWFFESTGGCGVAVLVGKKMLGRSVNCAPGFLVEYFGKRINHVIYYIFIKASKRPKEDFKCIGTLD